MLLLLSSYSSCNPRTYKSVYTNSIKGITSSLLLLSSIAAPLKSIADEGDCQDINLELDDVATVIKDNCKIVLNNARATGKLLYRGDSSTNKKNENILSGTVTTISKSKICNPTPDLLFPETYDNSPLAVDYFKALDAVMKDNKYLVSPSNGHIATSNVYDASDWGSVMSIWPFDDSLHYAWVNTGIKNENKWWELDWGVPQGSRGPVFWKNKELWSQFTSGIVYDKKLDQIMSKSGEIMFTRTNKNDVIIQTINNKFNINLKPMSPLYIAVPVVLENDLIKLLDIEPFSNDIKIVESQAMELDDVPKSRRYMNLVQPEGKGYTNRYGNPFLY
jgi:hypothetical protein